MGKRCFIKHGITKAFITYKICLMIWETCLVIINSVKNMSFIIHLLRIFYGIVNVITNKWPVLKNLYCREYGPIIPKYLEILCKDKKGSRALYDIFLNNITSIPKSENKWELLLNLGYDLNWKKIYQNIFNFTNDTKLIWFQYRIIHRILATNKYLHAIKIKNDPLCSFCRTLKQLTTCSLNVIL